MKKFAVSSVLVVLLTASGPLAGSAAAAAPTLTAACVVTPAALCVSDAAFGSGATVTVSGTGFGAGADMAVWLDTNGDGVLQAKEPMVELTVDGAGALSTPLLVADVPAGLYAIDAGNCPRPGASDPCTGATKTVSASVTVMLSSSPSRFGSGSTITITGYGFTPASGLTVWFDSNNNNALDAGEQAVALVTGAKGEFSTSLLASGAPGRYSVRAGPPAPTTASTAVDIGTCWFQDCFINGADTICLFGNSPTDFATFFADCKKVDSNYSDPTPATPTGGYDFSNVGPAFAGAGLLAAATNDLGIPGVGLVPQVPPGIPGSGCAAIEAAIALAQGYGNTVPDGGWDLSKPFTDLTDIACSPNPGVGFVVPPFDALTYIGAEEAAGHNVPDKGFMLAMIAAIQTAAAAAGGAVIAAGLTGGAAGPIATTAALTALSGVVDPVTAASLAAAIGTAVAIAPLAAFAAAPLLVAAILLAAQQALAMAAVAGDIACGFVNYYCNGSDITANILAKPDLQQELIPVPFLQPPFANAPDPNPCRTAVGAAPVNGRCWGDVIGWAQVSCTRTIAAPDDYCELPGRLGNYPNLAVPGSAGSNNTGAPNKCATGKVLGLSIGYDGDMSFDVYDPSILPLVNYHNFQPGPGGTDPPNGIDVEIPLHDTGPFFGSPHYRQQLAALRPGVVVTVCGQWVADMHMLWNELHPVTSLVVLSDTVTTIVTPAANADLPTGLTTVTARVSDSGAADADSCTAQWDGGAATPATMTLEPTVSTPGTCVASTSGLSPGPHTATLSVSDGDSARASSSSVSFTINAPPALVLPGEESGHFNDGLSFGISATDHEARDTVTLSASDLPAGLSFTDNGDRTGTVSGTATAGPGTYTATFGANDGINPTVYGTLAITVTQEDSQLAFTGPQFVGNGQPLTLAATLTDPTNAGEAESATPISGKSVAFTLGSGGSSQTCNGTTNASGVASCAIASVNQPLGTTPVGAAFAGDTNYLPASASTSTIAFGYLSRGAFIVGDKSAVVNATVTWWSPSWSSANNLTGGAAPSSFKGFGGTLSSTPPVAGGTWSTSGGTSTGPPSVVPSYMAVIVASRITKSGSTISFSGTDARIAIVQVFPGYNPVTGVPGTGKLLGFLP